MKPYELIYEGSGSRVNLVRCKLKEGVKLYEIKARLAKNQESVKYYYAEYNEKGAKAKFKENIPYMEITGIRCIEDESEQERILTDPLKMPM